MQVCSTTEGESCSDHWSQHWYREGNSARPCKKRQVIHICLSIVAPRKVEIVKKGIQDGQGTLPFTAESKFIISRMKYSSRRFRF